jgi:hypothetical protein
MPADVGDYEWPCFVDTAAQLGLNFQDIQSRREST